MVTITIEERAMRHYRNSAPHIQSSESCQLIKLLVEEIQRLKAQMQVEFNLKSAAVAVIEMECERVNAGGGEPYDPIVNPGQFDHRIVALAEFVT